MSSQVRDARSGSRPRPPRTRTPIVDQHATWIAVNPVQGCPMACVHCFLNERGQTAVRSEQFATPVETVNLLTASQFYEPSRPVALYTWTDVMALPASRAHLAELLGVLADRQFTNPLVLITKCHVPDETVETIAAARRLGLRVIVYLSYSGLGRDIERGIRHEAIADNFPRLAEADIPVVHYWRPAFPESANPEKMERVIALASRFARCTVAAGLKVERAPVARLAEVWPELAETPGVAEAEGVYPRPFWDFIHRTWQQYPGYPLFHTNSCALAYVFAQADRFGVFRSTTCRTRNNCPTAQRNRCTVAAMHRASPGAEQVRAALEQRGLAGVRFSLTADGQELVIHAAVATSITAALTQDLGVRVKAARQDADAYWSSGTAGAVPLVLG
ncbi:hypothetical protein [Gandjariella thermophila]|uniref:Radical SAM core domain-containing protein n=1 Tax=Gandjariella thermophila TaxID=1931992 RepID=A0A4D4J2V8_9PSEU|nr:hypothetical protein [Gandjariella thermophila]GDY29754.1 hypothetical protein GTS_13870 [Gandjariella thermophila]